MAAAEHREPYELRGSRTVLGAPEGETPSGDSSKSEVAALRRDVCFAPVSGNRGRDCRGDDALARTVADHPSYRLAGSLGACHPPPVRAKAPIQHICSFQFLWFRLLNAFQRAREMPRALICFRPRCRAGRGSTRRSASGFSKRACGRRCDLSGRNSANGSCGG